MKNKTLILTLLLIFVAGGQDLNAQSLVVRLNDGTENIELLGNIQKLTFTVNDLLLELKSGQTDVYGLPLIQKLYFDTGTGTPENTPSGSDELTIFPNPADNVITIRNLAKEKGTLNIYRSDGVLMHQQDISNDTETINIRDFHSGLYFIQANGRTAKFIRL
ncbi:MAG: T9SS type A sorting domain-containing protein [Bacteroidota bacterium]